ncbi:hypothetical protein C8R46DRAFT_1106343 [Mycena filopes]|nr:hypothetical protein C8R46DRAFT_1106343 [Mycena filopes]
MAIVSLLSASPEVLRNIVLFALDTPAMHALLFANAFHVPADMHHLLPGHAKAEMQRRFRALRLFRRDRARCLDDRAAFTDALWVAYVMLRLLWAGLPELLLLYLQQRLNDGVEKNHGWPLCNETNSLVIALMWLLSSDASVRAESPATRDTIMDHIKPFALAAFRETVIQLPPPVDTWNTSPSTHEVVYFGARTVQLPSAPIPMFPVHLSSVAQSALRIGPRREDVEHFIKECRTRFEPWDFAAPETMNTFCRQPMYVTLQEYVRRRAEPENEKQSREAGGWLPTSWVEKDGGIEVLDERTTSVAHLEENVEDVLVMGQTDDPYASAWGAFKIFGRVRLSDGLIVLRRESVSGMGTTLLRGYMSSHQHFAGRYRAIHKGNAVAEWEAAFSLCKMDPVHNRES